MNQTMTAEISATQAQALFEAQLAFAPQVAKSTAADRIAKLNALQRWILQHRADIEQAVYQDFKKPPTATAATELGSVFGEINFAVKNLKHWTKSEKVAAPLSLTGTYSYIKYEPKGVCLIISPWNYPFSLSVKPLISAIAAGNTVIIKPSEITAHTSNIIQKMIDELFEPQEIAVLQGGVTVAQELLALPFHHIFFTGSPKVGKIVMRAAAEHLTSVTLELGGKSPAIIDRTADLYASAEKIAWGKFINNGQTCIAPDYLFVEESILPKFLENLAKVIQRMFDAKGKGIQQSEDYARIVNDAHFERLQHLLDDALENGATLALGGETDATDRYIAPTVLTKVTPEMLIMEEEIFGPLLPIMTYRDAEKQRVLSFINSRQKPLALYVFTKDDRIKNYFLDNTTAGTSAVNDCLIQFAHVNLPFGGVNNSGIGKSGGHFGFLEFSNARAVVEQRFAPTRLIYPPYTDKVKKMVDLILRFG